jgi:hypothetical protein
LLGGWVFTQQIRLFFPKNGHFPQGLRPVAKLAHGPEKSWIPEHLPFAA